MKLFPHCGACFGHAGRVSVAWGYSIGFLILAGGLSSAEGQAAPSKIVIPAAASLPVLAAMVASTPVAPNTGQLLGIVINAAGNPEAGAIVEVRSDTLHGSMWRRLTSTEGYFAVTDLAPGAYYLQAGKGERVATRRRVQIHASERAMVLVDLPQIAHAIQFGPPGSSPATDDQQFRWTLRQSADWRPVLRLDGAGSPPTHDEGQPPQGYFAVVGGGEDTALGTPLMATAFRIETSLGGVSSVDLSGDVGTSGVGADSRVEAMFRPSVDPNSQARFLIGVRQIANPAWAGMPVLRVVSLNYADGFNLGDNLHFQFGTMFNTVTMLDSVHTLDPYLRVAYSLGDNAGIEYRVASAVPPLHFTRDYADMPDPTPQVTLAHGAVQVENARHQELQYSDRLTPTDGIAVAVFVEHYSRTAVNGAVSEASEIDNGEFLPGFLTNNGLFVADGGSYGGEGYRLSFDHRFSDQWRGDIEMVNGPVLVVRNGAFANDDLSGALAPQRAYAWTAKVDGVTPLTRTHVIGSYRGLSRTTVTGVDLYDDGLAQSDSYANLFLRQPLPQFLAPNYGKLEAVIEFHNLLAQGYSPMTGDDGRALYLLQSARSLRCGLSLNF